jgi:hypothetical protein
MHENKDISGFVVVWTVSPSSPISFQFDKRERYNRDNELDIRSKDLFRERRKGRWERKRRFYHFKRLPVVSGLILPNGFCNSDQVSVLICSEQA